MKPVFAAQFWNEEVSSSRSLDGVSHSLPREPPPLGMVARSHLSRSQQLLLVQRMVRIPCTPSYAVDADNEGGLVLDRVLGSTGGENWWTTLTGRVRAQRLFGKSGQNQKNRTSAATQDLPIHNSKSKWQENLDRLLDSSLYALCLRSRIQLGPRTSLSSTSELDTLPRHSPRNKQAAGDERSPWRGHIALRHKLDRHQILTEAAFHECYVDRHARYWEVPQALSVDVASQGAPGGLRYRLGVHHSAGVPLECGREDTAHRIPLGALPGTQIQAGASLEKSLDIWKGTTKRKQSKSQKSYSLLEARPHISLSGIVGGLLSASLKPQFGATQDQGVSSSGNAQPQARSNCPTSADLFASLGLSAQFGLFEQPVFNYTKVGVRIDLGTPAAVAEKANLFGYPILNKRDDGGHPTLVLSLQQQVVGPLRARVDSRVGLDASNSKEQPHIEEVTYGLDYSLEALGTSKLCVWYSPTRREGMAELRVLER